MAQLGTVDYVMFALMLMVSAGIGIYFRFSGGKQKTTEEYLLAGKDMSILPVAFSLMASFLSAITVMGVPADIYMYGIHYAYVTIGHFIGMLLSVYIFLPVFFELQASTAYEYLERRFGRTVKVLTSLTFVCQMVMYMSVVLYAPALALSAITNLPTWVSVISIGIVCTFYCTLGGMKAVLWTDVFQVVLMFLGMFTVLIKGFVDVGFNETFRLGVEGGRILVPGFEVDLTTRYTMWNLVIQGTMFSLTGFGANQVQIQRLLTVKNLTKSRHSVFLNIPMAVSFNLLSCLAGVVIYAFYANCDPMKSPDHSINAADQLLPYYMVSALADYPGLPGICICGIFSASLSTVSSAVNSLTAVTMQDFLKPFLDRWKVSERWTSITTQLTTLFYGSLCIALAFVVESFGDLIQAALTVLGMLGGPVLAIFALGMLTTTANSKGTAVGLLLGVAFSGWVSFGSMVHAPPPYTLPISLEGCPSANRSLTTEFASTLDADIHKITAYFANDVIETSTFEPVLKKDTSDYVFPLYRISYMWFGFVSFVATVVIGYVASLIVCCFSGEQNKVPIELLSPLRRYFMRKKTDDSDLEKKPTNGFNGTMELEDVRKFKSAYQKEPVQGISIQRL